MPLIRRCHRRRRRRQRCRNWKQWNIHYALFQSHNTPFASCAEMVCRLCNEISWLFPAVCWLCSMCAQYFGTASVVMPNANKSAQAAKQQVANREEAAEWEWLSYADTRSSSRAQQTKYWIKEHSTEKSLWAHLQRCHCHCLVSHTYANGDHNGDE